MPEADGDKAKEAITPIAEMPIPKRISGGIPCPLAACVLPPRHPRKLCFSGPNLFQQDAFETGNVLMVGCYVGSNTLLDGDTAPIHVGESTFIDDLTIIRPSLRLGLQCPNAQPLQIGSYTYIGPRGICEPYAIGSFVIVEADCIIGDGCTLNHGCWVRARSVLPANTVVPAFTVMAGNPARIIAALPEDTHPMLVREYISQHLRTFTSPDAEEGFRQMTEQMKVLQQTVVQSSP